ncbi:hypothetical protein NJ7G_0946 [Natrinema sp. J7-2]|uniref:Uncharacterized protein n=1 Tax=Natrinema gari JCM 14663 TaxID=1230459 RepID=L9ZBX5_9EURY|nr:hypothetical protein NJ7G_0946 [Natrinema sp. J7-2]ELY83909.1 hypothetical protein C486_01739 [Natrinema gari JCM 14663]
MESERSAGNRTTHRRRPIGTPTRVAMTVEFGRASPLLETNGIATRRRR